MKKKLVRKKDKKKNSNAGWIIKIIILAFVISVTFSFASETILSNVGTVVGIIVLLLFVLLGVVFDMIGVAVTSTDIGPFNSMSAQKVRGADIAVKFKKNADKVSSFCNDVVGDICGIISGSAGVIVASSIATAFDLPKFTVTLVVTGIVASLTIGGKALGKGIAINNSTSILHGFAEVVSMFYNVKK